MSRRFFAFALIVASLACGCAQETSKTSRVGTDPVPPPSIPPPIPTATPTPGPEKPQATGPTLRERSTLVTSDVSLYVSADGGVAIRSGGRELRIGTSLGMDPAYPGLADYPAGSAYPSDMPAVDLDACDTTACIVRAHWKSGLKLRREIRLGDRNGLVSWTDMWINEGKDVAAVPLNYQLSMDTPIAPRITLGGNPDTLAIDASAFNPTLHLGSDRYLMGFGLVAEDDLLRHLLRFSKTASTGYLSSRNLALDVRKSITFSMTVYAMGTPSYWDFINEVRRSWDVNTTRLSLPLAWASQSANPAAGPLLQTTGPWLNLSLDARTGIQLTTPTAGALADFYTYPHRAAGHATLAEQMLQIRQSAPETKLMLMVHPSMEVAYKPMLSAFPYVDELILRGAGIPFEDAGYSLGWLGSTSVGLGWGVLYVMPSRGSAYAAELASRVRLALDDLGADGVYVDEFTFTNLSRTYSRYDYRQWDGMSVLLNADGSIHLKVTDNGLASVPNQLALIQLAKERDKFLLANTAPTTRAVQTAGVFHFSERGNGKWWGANQHLSTPLLLGNAGQPATRTELMAQSRLTLAEGALHVPHAGASLLMGGPDDFVSKQFPITPVRVGPGYVMGPERLVTTVTGEFDWVTSLGAAQVYVYDQDGNLVGGAPKLISPAPCPFRVVVPLEGLVIAEAVAADDPPSAADACRIEPASLDWTADRMPVVDPAAWDTHVFDWKQIQIVNLTGGSQAHLCARQADGIHCADLTGPGSTSSPRTGEFSDGAGWGSDPSLWATIQYADVNGDGRLDVCGRGAGRITCALNEGATFGPGRKWTYRFSNALDWDKSPSRWATIRLVDITGDGKADICGRSPEGIECLVSTGSGFESPSIWTPAFSDAAGWDKDPSYWATISFPDLNGDGKADVCGRGASGLYCALSTGTAFASLTRWSPDLVNAAGFVSSASYWRTIAYPDLNGDRKADLCVRGGGGMLCALSDGESFAPLALWTYGFSDAGGWKASESSWGTIRFADVNGDGKDDACGRTTNGSYCTFSIGTALSNPVPFNGMFADANGWSQQPSFWRTLQLVDVNGDGRADYCGRGTAGMLCAISSGTSFADRTLWAGFVGDGAGYGTQPSW